MPVGGEPNLTGGYRVVRRLGQGVVYLAESPEGALVAVKIAYDHADEQARARFLQEVTTARRVAPFCTARVLEAGENAGVSYMVSEYIDGPSLRELVGRDGRVRGAGRIRGSPSPPTRSFCSGGRAWTARSPA
ncbi:hypothetical protein SMC26_11900 [Actinomadura fulvescens]|uniref:Protein kinase domain-containing protein n=1 Tax=Actinomadura fulvescens TaxID=46160 RepID=A0ABN3PEK5_9ACTN